MSVCDQKSLNNSVLLRDELKFHEHQILMAREGIELDKQEDFIYNISISKINFQIADTLQTLLLTKLLWNYIFDHMKYFFDVIIGQNMSIDYERIR